MWLAVSSRWCLLLAASVLVECLSAIPCCSSDQTPRASEKESDGKSYNKPWSELGEMLVLSKVDDTGETLLLTSRQELIMQLKQDFRKTISFPTALSNGVNISQQCVEDSIFYIENLFIHQANWALQMLDSSAQLPTGIVANENYHAEGLFDECLAIRSVPDRFVGQYCTVFFQMAPVDPWDIISNDDRAAADNDMPNNILRRLLFDNSVRVKPKFTDGDLLVLYHNYPSYGLCLPASCSAADLGQSVANLIGQFVIANHSIVTIANENFCFSREDQSFDGLDVVALWILALLAVTVFLATIHEAWRTHRGVHFATETDSLLVSILHCFSATSNGRKLLSMSTDSSSLNNLDCLNGIRVITTFWLICVHTLIRVVGLAKANVSNPKIVEQEAMSWQKQILVNSSVSVDSFFMVSGLLVSYLLLRELDRTSGKLRLGLLYLHRYLRLTPVYAIVLLFVATLLVYTGTGPEWYYITSGADACRQNWWQHLLYIDNLYPLELENLCMFETWYMAVDTQLFLVAPFFVYLLWRWEKTGLATLAVFTFLSLAANVAVFAFYDNFPPTLMLTRWFELKETFTSFVDNYYMKTWARVPPYMVGLVTGWFLHRAKDSELNLHKGLVAFLWTLSLATCTLIIYGLSPYVDETTTPAIDWAVRMMYGPFHRVIWALSLAWIITACIHGYGGFLNDFLSWRGFRPFSRLSYCIYLIHFEYMQWYYAVKTRKIYGQFFDLLTMFFGISVIVLVLAFLLSVFVEAPFINLEKLVFSPPKKRKGSIGNKSNEMVQSFEDETSGENNNIITLKKRRTIKSE